jgi:predicted NACHT family NTPase
MKGAGWSRARRTGAAALGLLCATTVTALVLARSYHLGVAATLVAILGGLPGLYLGWVSYRDAQHDADEARSLEEIADGLAARLRSQWGAEAEARGLNDPYPLPVAWTAADPPLAGDLDVLKRLAASGAGWSAQGRETWARGPGDLAGGGDRKLADVLAMVPTGRLVVLGEPGAGKTMLMVGLVLDLLHPDRRSGGGPVPVLASLASWDPVSQDLHGWLGATLITDYPDLGAAAPPGSAGDNRFEALLEAGLIVPVLDGLDEVPESARPAAITRINKELKPGEQVVVTCRTEQYRATVSPQDGQGAALRAVAVQLCTLEFDQVGRPGCS